MEERARFIILVKNYLQTSRKDFLRSVIIHLQLIPIKYRLIYKQLPGQKIKQLWVLNINLNLYGESNSILNQLAQNMANNCCKIFLSFVKPYETKI